MFRKKSRPNVRRNSFSRELPISPTSQPADYEAMPLQPSPFIIPYNFTPLRSGDLRPPLSHNSNSAMGVLSEAPPGYDVARLPVNTIRYNFSNIGPSCMLLLPSSESPDTRPVYHISVSMNCFAPCSSITTVTRGGTADGDLVGDFEMGDGVNTSVKKPTVSFRGKEYPMETLVSRSKMKWTWFHPIEEMAFGKSFFTWDCTYWRDNFPVFYCKLNGSPFTPLAAFTPQTDPPRQGRPRTTQTLEVTPEGHRYFDEIILSLLIVEAERTTRRVES
ncbi:hypothetical protein AN958_01407 [Leucoagaricus sp. SymC.cos]|nr:hypothetical protein AN958_01407 [Leucoagaricus sp. SymC.cos]